MVSKGFQRWFMNMQVRAAVSWWLKDVFSVLRDVWSLGAASNPAHQQAPNAFVRPSVQIYNEFCVDSRRPQDEA